MASDQPSKLWVVLRPVGVVAALIGGGALQLSATTRSVGHALWMVALVVAGAPTIWQAVRALVSRQFAVDVVAALAIGGAVLIDQPLAGLIIVLMQSGGVALEAYAAGRASAAVRALEESAPRIAHRVADDGTEDLPAEAVLVGDLLLVRPGELIPCDAVVVSGLSTVDTSRLTGEPLPLSAREGTRLLSGSINGDRPLEVRATAIAGESQYARIVELVRSAQASKAPLQRVADRYAIWFTPLTLLVCLAAYLLTRDPVRVVAVLVVATPCPLILAVPVAIVSGISNAARHRIIVRHGEALERLAAVTVAVFDKTGTLTIGAPRVRRLLPAPGIDAPTLLQGAAAIEHGSGHLLARTIVSAAEEAALSSSPACDVVEVSGRGVTGSVNGRAWIVGSRAFVEERLPLTRSAFAALDAEDAVLLRAYVAVDGRAAGVIEFADAARPELGGMLSELKHAGVTRVLLLSGDQDRYTQAIARAVGIDEAHGDLLPGDKVRIVNEIRRAGSAVMMVGDGTNDAPALAAADVGVALAGHGGGIAAETAGVVLLTDDVGGVIDAVVIARRTLRIARQSIWVGLGLSGAAMIVAAAGMIPPTIGAVLQEIIDVTVIFNALRASHDLTRT